MSIPSIRTLSSWSARYNLPKLPSLLCWLRLKRYCRCTMGIVQKLNRGIMPKARTSLPWIISRLLKKKRCLLRLRIVSIRSSGAYCWENRSLAWSYIYKIMSRSIRLSNLPKCMNRTSRRSKSMWFPLKSILCRSTTRSYRRS